MLNSLHVRLTLAIVLVMALLAVVLVLLLQSASRRYSEELLQRLNADVAMYVTDELALLEKGRVNRAALQELSRRVMTVNPSAEVYLLDADGHIVDTLVDRAKGVATPVAIEPIERFLARDTRGAIYGDDPLQPGARRVFSAARFGGAEADRGYLYVVLGGRPREAVGAELQASHALRVGALTALLLVMAAAATAAGTFWYLTRRLRRLDARLRHWMTDAPDVAIVPAGPASSDEIAQLEARFGAMSATIDRQLAELRAADELRRELVANVSHDLRTPLSTLRGYLETIQLKGAMLERGEREQYLAVALRQTEHLTQLVDALFELARLDSGVARPNFEPVALDELLHDIAMRFRIQAQGAGVTITAVAGAALPAVLADVALLERAIANLVDNALRHTPAGGQVRLEAWAEADVARVRVSDTGVGIDAERLPRIFDRHYTHAGSAVGAKDARPGAQRAGLGLAIVKRVLELHGQRIRALSRTGAGTSFEFALTYAAPAAILPQARAAAR